MTDTSPPPLYFGKRRSSASTSEALPSEKVVQHPKDQAASKPALPTVPKTPVTLPKIDSKPTARPDAKPADKPAKQTPVTAPRPISTAEPKAPAQSSKAIRTAPPTVSVSAPPVEASPVEVLNPLLVPEDDDTSTAADNSERSARGSGGKRKRRASRFVMTDQHMEVLRWIDKARYTTGEQVAVYLDRDCRSARKILGKLEAHGYVKRKQFAGFPVTYFLSESAKDLLESPTRKVDEASGPGFIRHTLSVGWVMLAMLKGGLPVAEALAKELGRQLALSDFVSESEVQRAANRHFGKVMTALEQKARKHDSQAYIRKWEGWKAVAKEAKAVAVEDELSDANLFAWAFYGDGVKPHYPDLMLRLPRSPQSNKTLSIAFEIERSMKPASVEDILAAYREGKPITPRYGQCVWFCGNENVLSLVKGKVEEAKVSHAVTSLDIVMAWKRTYVTHLEEEARATTAAHQQARQQGYWHVTCQLSLARCTCGTTCRAKHGRFATRQEAFDLLDEMA